MGRPLLIKPAQIQRAAELHANGIEWITIAGMLGFSSTTFTHNYVQRILSAFPECKKQFSKNRRNKSREAEWGSWMNMKTRCLNPNSDRYPFYGGRGIKVCERWLSYDNFLADMGRKPTPQHSLERLENDKNYEPGNCVWATKKAQARNRRSSKFLEFDGERKTVAEWAEVTHLPYEAIQARLKLGWTVEQALTLPLFSSKPV